MESDLVLIDHLHICLALSAIKEKNNMVRRKQGTPRRRPPVRQGNAPAAVRAKPKQGKWVTLLEEMKKDQNMTYMIGTAAFRRIVLELSEKLGGIKQWTFGALRVLQEVAEQEMTSIFALAGILCQKAKRKTLIIDDLSLANLFFLPFSLNFKPN
ncbi:uncharacterized protein ACB058_020246 [Synchiropus picturatus]